MTKERFRQIKAHFEQEAVVFDKLFFKVMPCYEEMMGALVGALPFNEKERVRIVDLGCGTGNLARKIILRYPLAHLTCLDMAENMLKMAKTKLENNRNVVEFWQGDIREFDYSAKYDAIVSSMVLHHVEGRDKPAFYRKLFRALKAGGVFFNIDIFLSPDTRLQALYMEKWIEYMKSSGLSGKKINEMVASHQKEDRPAVFTDELEIMRRAGFPDVDVVLKHYNFAVYGAAKKSARA